MSDMNKQWEICLATSINAHAGQVDKVGFPYSLHVLNVALALEPDLGLMCAGVLHDVIEDCDLSATDLRERGVADETIRIVEILTRKNGETYDAFVERISTDARAVKVKLADISHNLRADRMRRLPDQQRQALTAKYEQASEKLKKCKINA